MEKVVSFIPFLKKKSQPKNLKESDSVIDKNTKDIPIRKQLGEPIIQVYDLSKAYKIRGREETVMALKKIDVNDSTEFYGIRRGEFVMIRGPSGGGKTTLLNMIGTIDRPSNGKIDLFGKEVNKKSSDNYLSRLRLDKIGFVFQTFNLISSMSAFENVELPMTLYGKLGSKSRRKKAKLLLGMVGLEDRLNHLPSELSGGEQQRVTIARALANDPDVLLLDEPTGDLDTKNTIEIMNLILRINLKHKTTCIMVTHNPDLECYADRILYVKDGVFEKQAINEIQSPLILQEYTNYLKKKHHQSNLFSN